MCIYGLLSFVISSFEEESLQVCNKKYCMTCAHSYVELHCELVHCHFCDRLALKQHRVPL